MASDAERGWLDLLDLGHCLCALTVTVPGLDLCCSCALFSTGGMSLSGSQVGENSQRETNCGHTESDSGRTALANVAIGTCNGTCKMDLHGSCMTSTIIQQAQVLI